MKNLPQKIRRLRLLKNYTQDYMAQCLGISRQTFCKIESGKAPLTLERVAQIAGALGCPDDDLMWLPTDELFIRLLYKNE